VEGAKSVHELLASDFELVTLLGTTDFLTTVGRKLTCEVIEVSPEELDRLGEFQTNDTTLVIARQKANTPMRVSANEFALVRATYVTWGTWRSLFTRIGVDR
jgi:RNA methyltransferase, TrmH family